MKISGSGTVKGGDYNEEIRISGSGTIDGNIRCTELHASGSVRVNGYVECEGEISVSGSGSFEDVKAKRVISSGSFGSGSLSVDNKLETSGSCKVKGALYADEAIISGSLEVRENAKFGKADISGGFVCDGDTEAEDFRISGPVTVNGLLNAENINIKLGQRMYKNRINSIGGTNIKIEISPLALFRKKAAVLSVKESIEGDEIYLENTECPLVIGKNVVIGEGCKIGKVQHYNSCKISEEAEVCKEEKI